MQYLPPEEIFPDNYINPPDERDLRQYCYAYASVAHLPDDFTDHISRTDCPYLRDARASAMGRYLREHTGPNGSDDEHINLPCYIVDEVLRVIDRIIDRARNEQRAIRRICQLTGTSLSNPSRVLTADDPEWVQLRQQVARLCEQQQTFTPRWGYYTAAASERQMRQFEAQLEQLCQNRSRSMTAEIKQLMDEYAAVGVITRPEQIKDEYKLVCRFGYPRSIKTYYNT